MLRYFVLFCFLFFILANLQAAHADQLDDQQATFSYAKGTRYLPIVIINTRGRSIGQDKVPATIQIIDNPDGINTLWSPPTLVSKINIKIRGHSSRKYPKKQFSIDFLDLFGNQRMVEPFGLPKSDNWAISAPYTDKTLIRNPFAYDLGSAIAKGTPYEHFFAPKHRYVEVFLLEDVTDWIPSTETILRHYWGVYVWSEKVEVEKNRVNLNMLASDSFLVKVDRVYEDSVTCNAFYGRPEKYVVEWPKFQDQLALNTKWGQARLKYICDTLVSMERAIYDYNSSVVSMDKFKDIIDVDSLIDHILIQEWSNNVDQFRYSLNIYKDTNAKIKWTPLWDFDIAWGNHNHEQVKDPRGGWFHQGCIPVHFAIAKLLRGGEFVYKLVQRWKVIRSTVASDEKVVALMQKLRDEIGSDAINRNFQKWPILGKIVGSNPVLDPPLTTYDQEFEYMKWYVLERAHWMDQNIDALCTASNECLQNQTRARSVVIDDFNDSTRYNDYKVNKLGFATGDDNKTVTDSVYDGVLSLTPASGYYWYSIFKSTSSGCFTRIRDFTALTFRIMAPTGTTLMISFDSKELPCSSAQTKVINTGVMAGQGQFFTAETGAWQTVTIPLSAFNLGSARAPFAVVLKNFNIPRNSCNDTILLDDIALVA